MLNGLKGIYEAIYRYKSWHEIFPCIVYHSDIVFFCDVMCSAQLIRCMSKCKYWILLIPLRQDMVLLGWSSTSCAALHQGYQSYHRVNIHFFSCKGRALSSTSFVSKYDGIFSVTSGEDKICYSFCKLIKWSDISPGKPGPSRLSNYGSFFQTRRGLEWKSNVHLCWWSFYQSLPFLKSSWFFSRLLGS